MRAKGSNFERKTGLEPASLQVGCLIGDPFGLLRIEQGSGCTRGPVHFKAPLRRPPCGDLRR